MRILESFVALSAVMAWESVSAFSTASTHMSRMSTIQSSRFGGLMRIKSKKGEAQKESEMRAEAAERRVAQLQAELGGGDSESSELRSTMEKMELQVKVKEDLIVKMKEQIEEIKKSKAEGDKALSIVEEKERLITNIKDAHQGEVEKLTKEKDALQKENEELKSQNGEKGSDHVETSAELERVKSELLALKESKDKELQEKDQEVAKIKETHRAELETLKKEKQLLEEEKLAIKSQVAEKPELNDQSTEIAALKNDIQAIKDENETLQKENIELQNQIGSANADQTSQIAQLTKQKNMLEQEKAYIQSQVENKYENENRIALNEVEEEKNELENKMAEMQAQLAALQLENEEKQHTLVQISRLNDDLSRQVHASATHNNPPGAAQPMPPPPMNGPGGARKISPPSKNGAGTNEQEFIEKEHKKDLAFIDGTDRSYIMKTKKKRGTRPSSLTFDSDAFLTSATIPTWRKRSDMKRRGRDQQQVQRQPRTHTLNFDGKTTVNTNTGTLSRETGGSRGADMRQSDYIGEIPVGQKKTHGRQATKGNTIPRPPEWRGQEDKEFIPPKGYATEAPPQQPLHPPSGNSEPTKSSTTKVLDFDSSNMAGTRPIPTWKEDGGTKSFK